MKDITFEQVDKMRIHELRDYAKDLKITSPTTLKKEDLVLRIKEKLADGQGVTANIRQELDNVIESSIMDILLLDDSELYYTLIDKKLKEKYEPEEDVVSDLLGYEKTQTIDYSDEDYVYPKITDAGFSFGVAQNEAYYDVESIDVQGYVDIHPMGYGILKEVVGYKNNSKNIYIPKVFIEEYNLMIGDFIKGFYRNYAKEDVNILTEISSIDGNADDDKTIRFDEVLSDTTTKKINCNTLKTTILSGKRYYISSMTEPDVFTFVKDVLSNNNINVKLFNIKTEFDYSTHASDAMLEELDIVDISLGTDDLDGLDTIAFALERTKREFENGVSNLVVINGFNELLKLCNVVYTGYVDYSKYSGVALNQMLKIMSIVKQYHDTGITLICIDRQGVCNAYQNLFQNEFSSMFYAQF